MPPPDASIQAARTESPFLVGGGEMAGRVRAHDWAATAFGPPAGWSPMLRTAVAMVLNSQFPMVLLWGSDHLIVYNDAYAEILGSRHPALGLPYAEVRAEIWEEMRPLVERAHAGMPSLIENRPFALDEAGLRRDRWFSFSLSPVFNDDGGVDGVVFAVVEKTALVLAIQRREFLLSLDAMLRDLADPFAIKTAVAAFLGRHLGVSRLGYSEAEAGCDHVFVEGDWNDADAPSLAGRHRQDDFGTGLLADLRANRSIVVADVRADPRTSVPEIAAIYDTLGLRAFLNVPLLKGGELTAMLFALHATPREWIDEEIELLRDVADRVWAAVARTRAETALRSQAKQLETIIETIPVAVWYTYDADARHIAGNRLAADLLRSPYGSNMSLSASPDERPGHFRVLRDGKDIPPAELPLQRAVRGEEVAEEQQIVFDDATSITILQRGAPLRDADGAIVGAVLAGTDLTVRKQQEALLRRSEEALRRLNEELEARVRAEVSDREQAQSQLAHARRMEALGQLAGGIAHDFNNVLQAVLGGLGLIQHRADDAEAVRRLAGKAASAASRGSSITGRLLTFARQGELRATGVPTRAMFDSLREMLVPTLGAGIDIRIETAPDIPPLLVDAGQLETVLVNLAINSRDAMPNGGTLILSAAAERVPRAVVHAAGIRPGCYVRLSLTDTGTGMDAATLARASEPFFTTKPVGKGTGLGLAMARGFAEQSGGGFTVRSTPDQGTTVDLWFPIAPPPRDTGISSALARTLPMSGEESPRVLVVDDDTMVREVLVGELSAHGYGVMQAPDGSSALARLDRGEETDLLVTDFAMPGMNGLTLIEEARRRRPRLPAMLLTGYADPGLLVAQIVCAREGVALLRKPVSGPDLVAKAEALLRERVVSA